MVLDASSTAHPCSAATVGKGLGASSKRTLSPTSLICIMYMLPRKSFRYRGDKVPLVNEHAAVDGSVTLPVTAQEQ